jgi:hypothetical protein
MNEMTKQHLSCMCYGYMSYGIPCVHIMCVTTGVKHEMCHIVDG